jgi:hypothetical protein
MNAYELLSNRLKNHAYKRGAHKGDAPLEKRKKSHVRIRRMDDNTVAVRMYQTDILVVNRDGTFRVALDSWTTSTTKTWLNYAFNISRINMSIYSKSVQSLSQLVMSTPYGYYLYYEGMEFDAESRLTSKPMPFEARRINKDAVAEFKKGIEDSGFKAMFPVLYGTATTEDESGAYSRPWNIAEMITDADLASDWSILIAKHKYERKWVWDPSKGTGGGYKTLEMGDAKSCWDTIMKAAKRNMYDTIRTEVTVIPK